MEDTPGRRTYPPEERERIRLAVVRFAADNGMKPYAVWGEILDKDPKARWFSHNTFYRFLGDANDTQDSNVDAIYEFVKDLPYYNRQRAFDILGDALAEFFADTQPPDESMEKGPALIPEQATITFTAEGERHEQGALDAIFSSELLASRDARGRFHLITEVLSRKYTQGNAVPLQRTRFEGVLVPIRASRFLAVLKDPLRREPRTAILVAKPPRDETQQWQLHATSIWMSPDRAASSEHFAETLLMRAEIAAGQSEGGTG